MWEDTSTQKAENGVIRRGPGREGGLLLGGDGREGPIGGESLGERASDPNKLII